MIDIGQGRLAAASTDMLMCANVCAGKSAALQNKPSNCDWQSGGRGMERGLKTGKSSSKTKSADAQQSRGIHKPAQLVRELKM